MAASMIANSIDTAPLDRQIEVRLTEEQDWVRVRWDTGAGWFEIEGEDMWVIPMELDAWREVAEADT